MPLFEALLPELAAMERISGSFNPLAVDVDPKCDAFVHVPVRVAAGCGFAFVQAVRTARLTIENVHPTAYIDYHRARVACNAGYRGPSAVAQWKAFYPETVRSWPVAQSLLQTLALEPDVTGIDLPAMNSYLNQPLTAAAYVY